MKMAELPKDINPKVISGFFIELAQERKQHLVEIETIEIRKVCLPSLLFAAGKREMMFLDHHLLIPKSTLSKRREHFYGYGNLN